MSEWTGEHTWNCRNSGRGGRAEVVGCAVPCDCPCHRGTDAVHAADQRARAEFAAKVDARRASQIEKGYTPEHDDAHGPDHLLLWAIEYAYLGRTVDAVALIQAARDVLVREASSNTREEAERG